MAETLAENTKFPFLKGGGEMGALIRAFDWSQTSVGAPEYWPQSLKTTVSIILSSKFPMFLWWGDDLVQFYNDAYRPSLGDKGKHPLALGQTAVECWPEIWDFIHPLIRQVQTTGEATWNEDQLLPIFRNGKMEDVYWTFSYSPVQDESGKVNGVLVVCNETTSKVLASKHIEESETRFRTMAEGMEIFVAVGDETSNATYFNQAWTYLTGRSMEELLDFGWADLIHPEDRETYVNIYLEAFQKREPFTGEFRIRDKNGDYRWLLAKGPPRFNSDGTFAGYISSCVDITDRKAVEHALMESEQQIRSLIESAPFPIGVYTGKEMRIQLANQNIIDVWGKGNDVIGKLYSEVLPELTDQHIFQQLDEVYTTGLPFSAKNQRVDLWVDGKLESFYFNYNFTPLFNSEGKVYGVMNTAAEVTDLNLARQKTEQSERNFRNMILQAPVAMCIMLGPEHTVEIANDMMLKLWGKPVADVMNKPIFEGLPDAREQGLEQLLENVYKTGETFTAYEMPVSLLRYGKYEDVYQNFVYEPYRDSDGTILGVLAITVDVTPQVTARRKIEEVVKDRTKALADANEELKRSNAELEQFAYIASHDLQEPLRKITTFLQMLEHSLGNVDDKSRRYLDKIGASTSRMTKLIRDVLTYSQLSMDSRRFETVDLNRVIEDIQQDFELLLEQKEATIIAEELPVLPAISLQMSQLLGNLISNALKFSRPDVKPVIRISSQALSAKELKQFSWLKQDRDYCKISFSDNGIGFQQEYAEQIFHIFQRLHGKAEFAGTGIGLSMCKKIALNHQGHIYADSVAGEGAVFYVVLPLGEE